MPIEQPSYKSDIKGAEHAARAAETLAAFP